MEAVQGVFEPRLSVGQHWCSKLGMEQMFAALKMKKAREAVGTSVKRAVGWNFIQLLEPLDY